MNVEISHIGLQRAYLLIQKSMVIFVDNACWPMIRRLNPVLWPPWLSFALWRWDHQSLGLRKRWGWMVINPYGEVFVLLPEKISWHEPWTPAKLIKHQSFTLYQPLLKQDPHNFFVRFERWYFDLFTLAKPLVLVVLVWGCLAFGISRLGLSSPDCCGARDLSQFLHSNQTHHWVTLEPTATCRS